MFGYVAFALAVFLVGLLVGYALVYYLGYILVDVIVSNRLFDDELAYIREHGSGYNAEENAVAFHDMWVKRTQAILKITYVIGSILAIVVTFVVIFSPLQQCGNDLARMALIFVSVVGVPLGIYKAWERLYDSERRAKLFVGRLTSVNKADMTALFEYKDGCDQFRHQEDFSGNKELFEDLEVDCEYCVGCFYKDKRKWRTCIGATDKSEWPEGEW